MTRAFRGGIVLVDRSAFLGSATTAVREHCTLPSMPNVDCNDVRQFLALARTGGLGRPADELTVSLASRSSQGDARALACYL